MQHVNRCSDVTSLGLLISAAGQQNDGPVNKCKVDPVSRTNVDSQFVYSSANRFLVASETGFQPCDASNDCNFGLAITQ